MSQHRGCSKRDHDRSRAACGDALHANERTTQVKGSPKQAGNRSQNHVSCKPSAVVGGVEGELGRAASRRVRRADGEGYERATHARAMRGAEQAGEQDCCKEREHGCWVYLAKKVWYEQIG